MPSPSAQGAGLGPAGEMREIMVPPARGYLSGKESGALQRHVDVRLLEKQEAFFGYAADWLIYLENDYLLRRGAIRHHAFPKAILYFTYQGESYSFSLSII